MSPGNGSEPREGARPEAATAERRTWRQHSADDGLQGFIPAHGLHGDEALLRRWVNRPRGPIHWWLRTPSGRHQLAFLRRMGWWPA
jgi:hypothetical protein